MRKLMTFLILTIMALNTYALGLSHIQVHSKLNEPLKAKINILSIPKGKANVVKVELASLRAFRRAGLERPFTLKKIKFAVQKTSKTSAIINVSSQQMIKEPFLNFLVEVSWPGGRILREYTILLDPPLYKPALAKKLITRNTLAVQPKYSPLKKANTPKKRPVKKRSTKKRVTSKSVKGGSYEVFKNDTLSQIAQRTRPQNVSLNRHMRKIYRANPSAFIRGNMNMIKSGRVLKIPNWNGKLTQDEINEIAQNSQRDTKRITTKNTPKAPESSLVKKSTFDKKSTSSPKLVLATPSKGNSQGKGNKELKKLHQQITHLNEKNSSIESENRVLKKEVAETKNLVTTMKQQLDEMNNMLLTFKSDGFAKLQSQLSKQAEENKRLKEQLAKLKGEPKIPEAGKKITFKPTSIPGLGEQAEKSTGATEIEKPVALEKPPEIVAEESSIEEIKALSSEPISTSEDIVTKNPKIIESGRAIRVRDTESESKETDFMTVTNQLVKENVPGGWIVLAAIIGGIILLILIIIIAKKRKPKSDKPKEPTEWKKINLSDEEIAIELARLDEESKPSDISETDILEDIEQTNESEVDPKFDSDLREEVDQYVMAEKYSLAENLMEAAIEKYPNNHKYRLELLEIYAAAKETDKFEKQAKLLHDAVGDEDPLWHETLELWKYLSPNKELSIKSDNKMAMVAGAAGVAGVAAAVAVSGDDETEFDTTDDGIDDGENLDLGDDLSLNLDGEENSEESSDDGLDLGSSDDSLDLGSSDDNFDLDSEEIPLDEVEELDMSSDTDDNLLLDDD
ncbi:MAG: LysM peptidoglycan-binding domain-containing protein, partial [Candidatus Marithrix sp.]|nr:LysM peptidoglycan-binding domain-containing protein [Candidatus Marithrix sp.]